MKSCPRCALKNPDTAVRCDCGFAFGEGNESQERAASIRLTWRWTLGGVLMIVLGLALTALTIAFPIGGYAVLFYGMPVAGVGLLWRGFLLRGDLKDAARRRR